ncbi:uncharacterized protein STEHIDRAFT_54565, partial [Stereum hirsutum FP-91666 SS1]|uniref:uncharacterized protein n=1 Tax=Stereum hirsutum (strain FP-91666) TaxID=721885 RepID=UPI000440D1B5
GWIYFSDPKQRLVTDEDIRIPEVYHNVEEYISTYSLENIDKHMEIVIPPGAEPGDHALTLVLNHLHSTASYILDEVKTENFHKLEHRIRTRRHKAYWNFLQWHPSHRSTPALAAVQVRDALTWYSTDNLVSGLRSTVPFSKAECEDLLRILDTSQGSSESSNAARTNFVSWILREIWNFRDAEEFGQHTFRQSSALRQQRADKGAAPPPTPPPVFIQSLLNLAINVLFFAIPWTYHAHVKDASEYRGRLSNMQKRWEDYIRRLVQEYQDFLLIVSTMSPHFEAKTLLINKLNRLPCFSRKCIELACSLYGSAEPEYVRPSPVPQSAS